MEEENFYCKLNMSPIYILSDCQYHNEFKYGVSLGEDICDHIDEEYDCNNCPKSKEKYLYYPPINYYVLLELIILCGLPDRISKDLNKQKTDILNHVLFKCNNEEIRKEVREFLIGYFQEYSRH